MKLRILIVIVRSKKRREFRAAVVAGTATQWTMFFDCRSQEKATWGEYTNSTQKGCEATLLTITPLCCPHLRHLRLFNLQYVIATNLKLKMLLMAIYVILFEIDQLCSNGKNYKRKGKMD